MPAHPTDKSKWICGWDTSPEKAAYSPCGHEALPGKVFCKAHEAEAKVLKERQQERVEKEGFVACPKCSTAHTRKTVHCRGCGHTV